MGGTSGTATEGCTAASSYGDGNVCDGYFGIPFWSAGGRDFYVPALPRIQNDLNLFAVDALTGAKRLIYNEKYPTWIDWFESMESDATAFMWHGAARRAVTRFTTVQTTARWFSA